MPPPPAPYQPAPASLKVETSQLCLPVLSVVVTATVEGTVAHIELVQNFHNPSDIIIPEARHIFPLYNGGVVTSFQCTVGDERRIRGVVKPKEQAREEYQKAAKIKMEAAALLEELSPEIFETTLGNIPPSTTIEIKMTYIHQLKIVLMEQETTEGVGGDYHTNVHCTPIWQKYTEMGTSASYYRKKP